MNKDWKGSKVSIEIRENLAYGSKEVKTITTTLDTDTMFDIFSKYPPKDGYNILIYSQAVIFE